MAYTPQALLYFLTSAYTNPEALDQLGIDNPLNYLDNFLRANTNDYFSALIEIASAKDGVVREVKFQAVTQFKNGVEKGWRRETLNADIKANLRHAILTLALDSDPLISKQAVQSVARIARFDTDQWPELFVTISDILTIDNMSLLPSENLLRMLRCLQTTKATLKALSTNRLLRGKQFMQALAPHLFPVLAQLYNQFFQQSLIELQNKVFPTQEVNTMVLSHLCFKCLATLTVYGYSRPHESQETSGFFLSSLSCLEEMLNLRQSQFQNGIPDPRFPFNRLNKNIVSFGKFYRTFADKNNNSLVAFGLGSKILSVYWSVLKTAASETIWDLVGADDDAVICEKLILQSILVIKNLFFDWHMNANRDSVIFTDSQAVCLLQLLVTRLLPLRSSDIENWQADPEGWISEEENDNWEVDIRPCAERLLMKLIPERTEVVGASLARMLDELSAATNPSLKDGLYCALRQSTYLSSHIDLNKVILSFISEAASTEPELIVVRRRIAWLLGHWIGERVSDDTQKNMYRILIHLMSSNASTDLVTRLTSASSFVRGDSWDFNPAIMAGFLKDYLEQLFDLMNISVLVETKIRLLATLGLLIERMDKEVLPYSSQLIVTLRLLWDGIGLSESENQLKIVVLQSLTKLVKADVLFDDSTGQISDIIDQAITDHGHILREDGLYLLSAYLQRILTLSPQVSDLLPAVSKLLLDGGTDTLPIVARIIESYLLLNADHTLNTAGTDILMSISNLLDTLDSRAVKLLQHVLETILTSSPPPQRAKLLDNSKVFAKILSIILNDGSCTTVVMVRYLLLISRIILADQPLFDYLMRSTYQGHYEEALGQLVLTMIDKFENLSSAGERKILSLGLAYLCQNPNIVIVRNLPSFVDIWCLAVAESEDEENEGFFNDGTISDFCPDDKTPESVRRTNEQERNSLSKLNTREVIYEKLCHLNMESGDIAMLVGDSWNELSSRLSGALRG